MKKSKFLKLFLMFFFIIPMIVSCSDKPKGDVEIVVDNSKTTIYSDDVETFDPTSLFTITVGGKEVQVKSEYITTNTVTSASGTYAVVLAYGGKTSAAVVNVVGGDQVSISLSAVSLTQYAARVSSIDFKSYFTVKVKGQVVDITDDMVTSNVKAVPGTYSYTVTLNGVSRTMNVTVLEDLTEPVAITVDTNGSKVSETTDVSCFVNLMNTTTSSDYTVTITGAGADYVEYSKVTNKVTMKAGADLEGSKSFTITFTSKEDTTKSASFKMVVAGRPVEGRVGNLTSAMLEEISNPNITVTGTISDARTIIASGETNKNVYNTTVKMEDGKWYGEWAPADGETNGSINYYQRSSTVANVEGVGNGHPVEEVFVGINNTTETKVIKNYQSIPQLWENAHYWNHLEGLKVAKFEEDTSDINVDAYNYVPDYKTSTDGEYADDEWLLTYIPYSLTPLMEDTLEKLKLIVEDGHVVGLKGTTSIIYNTENKDDATYFDYTEIELHFSNVGTTTIGDPTPYEAPRNAEYLVNAISKMKTMTNYTMQASEVSISAPIYDEGEYEVSSLGKARTVKNAFGNTTSSTGTVGLNIKVTEDAILIADTGKYTSSMDDKLYHTSYKGYKQVSATQYDYFEYGKKSDGTSGFVGQRKRNGLVSDLLPGYEFSPNIFSFAGMNEINGKDVYTFKLVDANLTNALAKQLSINELSKNAGRVGSASLTVSVDTNGNIVGMKIPYSFVGYSGYFNVTFSNIGTTSIPAEVFEEYEERVLKQDWALYNCKYYSPTFSTRDTTDADCGVVLEAVYGDKAEILPPPSVFFNIVGDNFNGPFYDWKQVGTDAEGNAINHGYISINCQIEERDENYMVSAETRDRIYDEFVEQMGLHGFIIDQANTNYVKGYSGTRAKVLTFVNDSITVVIEFYNANSFLYIDFYQTGDYTLKR